MVPFRDVTLTRGQGLYAEGLRTSVRTNAPAYGFSIMITSTFGVVASFQKTPRPWEVVLFATGSLLAFLAVQLAATRGFQVESADGERTDVQLLAAALNTLSVLGAVGGSVLPAALAPGWSAWLVSSLLGTGIFLLLNGVEFAVAEREQEGEG